MKIMKVTKHKRANNTPTPKRRDAIAARRAAVDWDHPSYGGLTKGDRDVVKDDRNSNEETA